MKRRSFLCGLIATAAIAIGSVGTTYVAPAPIKPHVFYHQLPGDVRGRMTTAEAEAWVTNDLKQPGVWDGEPIAGENPMTNDQIMQILIYAGRAASARGPVMVQFDPI